MDALNGVDLVQGDFRDEAVPAPDMAERVLKPGGGALIKVFEGSGFQEPAAASRGKFAKVRLSKPQASRCRSPEIYLLAKDFLMV